MTKSCTVVMNVYNEESRILSVLSQLSLQDHPEFDVLVIDDGSTDRTADIADTFKGQLRIQVVRRDHEGLAKARIAGLSMVDSEVAVIVDADMTVPPQWLSALASAFESPQVGGAYSRVIFSGDGRIARGGQAVREVVYAIRGWASKPWMIGHGMAIRTAALKTLELRPHDLFAEDLQLSQSLADSGWRIVQVAEPPIGTRDPETTFGVIRRHFRVGRRTVHLMAEQPRFLLRLSNLGRFFPVVLMSGLLVSWRLGAAIEALMVAMLTAVMGGQRVTVKDVIPGLYVFHVQTAAATVGAAVEGLGMLFNALGRSRVSRRLRRQEP